MPLSSLSGRGPYRVKHRNIVDGAHTRIGCVVASPSASWFSTTVHWERRGKSHLVTVFHELSQVQEGLCDFSDVLRSESQLNAPDELVLLVFIQFRPAGHKRGIEEIPLSTGKGEGCTSAWCHKHRQPGSGTAVWLQEQCCPTELVGCCLHLPREAEQLLVTNYLLCVNEGEL